MRIRTLAAACLILFLGLSAAGRGATTAPAEARADGAWYRTYLGEGSPYRGAAVAVLTLAALLAAYRVGTKRVRGYLEERAHKPENVRRFMRTWKSVWTFFIVVFVLISASGSLKWLGLSAGFLGMMLGWSLQAPVTGLAAWLMIVVKKPFRIGDRVIIAGTIGDVTDITLTHVILNQVGGTVGGEEQSGRGILIPNAILFSHVITNYTLEQKHMLDEVPIRVSFDSDVELAKKILLDAAGTVTKDIIAETGQEPFLRLEFYDAGVLIRLRYQTVPAERQRISSEIVDAVLRDFKAHYPDVRFGYPQSVIRYRRDQGGEEGEP
jgi:small-conductance mechanosensitive channel